MEARKKMAEDLVEVCGLDSSREDFMTREREKESNSSSKRDDDLQTYALFSNKAA